MWFDGKEITRIEISRLALCLFIGFYAYLSTSLESIAVSVLVYSIINILALPLINNSVTISKVQQI
jgi:hypothetical protein